MADRKVTALTELTAPAGDDVLPIIDTSESSNSAKNKKIQYTTLLRNLPSGSNTIPSLAWTADSGVTGLYRSAANTLSVSINQTLVGSFQSSGLQLGAGTPAAQLHLFSSDTTDQIIFENSDAGTDTAPDLVLYRNSASPADNDRIGSVSFRGRNDNSQDVDYAVFDVFATDVSDGTEDVEFDIRTIKGGTESSSVTFLGTETVFNQASANIDFRVESDGNANMLIVDAGLDAVLIGTSSEYSGTTADLTVNKHIDVGDSSSSDNAVIAGAKSATTGTILSIQSKVAGFSTMPKINFTTSNVGGGSQTGELEFFTTLNATQTLNFKIDGNGDLKANDTSIGSLSDERLKKDIEDFTYDLEKFKKLETKSFKWINPVQHGGKSDTVYGTIAQQIESVDADFVIEDELKATLSINDIEETNPDYTLTKDTKGVAKSSKVTGKKDAMYISVIQQLISKIETLETKVSTLEGG